MSIMVQKPPTSSTDCASFGVVAARPLGPLTLKYQALGSRQRCSVLIYSLFILAEVLRQLPHSCFRSLFLLIITVL